MSAIAPAGNGGPGRSKPAALSLLSSERPRNVGWKQAAGLLFGDWGTSRLYVLGLAFFFAQGTSFWLIAAMSLLILAVGWAYTQVCRLYPDGGGVYSAGRRKAAILGVVGALLLFADYTITASLSAVEAFHYFGLGGHTEQRETENARAETPSELASQPASQPAPPPALVNPGDDIRLPGAEDA